MAGPRRRNAHAGVAMKRETMRALPLADRDDLQEIGSIAVLSPLSWLLPTSAWDIVAAWYSRLLVRLMPATSRARQATLRDATRGLPAPPAPSELRLELFTGYMLERMAVLRSYRPGGWQPEIRLDGVHHIDRAREAGRGAVLWLAPLTYIDLVAKRALAEAGYELSHLSVKSRGFAPNGCTVRNPTRLNRQVLSPLRTRAESPYVSQRIEIEPDSMAYVRSLLKVLKRGDLVSIRAGGGGVRPMSVPFLDGSIELAGGAASLAQSTGAALLPVFAVPEGHQVFSVRIGASLSESDRESVEAMTRAFAAQLENFVTAHPSLWSGWYRMKPTVDA